MAAGRAGLLNRLSLQKGANISHQDSLGRTPLFVVAIAGRCDAVRFLLEMGADHRIKASSGRTALDGALLHGGKDDTFDKIVQLLRTAKEVA